MLKNIARDIAGLSQYLHWYLFKRGPSIKCEDIKNLLVVFAGAVGDSYNVIGLMNAMNKKYPKVNISCVTKESNKKFIKSPKIKVLDKEDIRAKDFDAVIFMQGSYIKPQIYCLEMDKIPYSITCETSQIKPSLFLKQLKSPSFNKKIFTIRSNGFEDQMKAFQKLGFEIDKPVFYHTEEAIAGEEVIFIHIGSGKTTKAMREGKVASTAWVAEYWTAVADALAFEYKVIFTGTLEERGMIDQIISNMKNKALNLAGRTSSVEMVAALLQRGKLLITIDTGISHIGAQVGIPMIILYGATPPHLVSPITNNKVDIYHPEDAHDCRGYACEECYEQHMKSITPFEILNHAWRIL